jgi:chorismate mutase
VLQVATELKNSNIQMMRAGVWKPRTRPGSFEGMGAIALPWLQQAKLILHKPICIEVATAEQVELALKHDIDALWIGARSTVNPFTVQEIADALKGVNIPVLIKNPINPDVELWMGGIERISKAGITQIAAIHRGFSSYGKSKYRNAPMWSIPIELRRRMPELPIICDPSHITGKRNMIQLISQRAMDLQLDGLMIEIHPNPDSAWSDAAQQITPTTLNEILQNLKIKTGNSITNQNDVIQIEELRQQIDELDAEVIDIIAKRLQVAEKLGIIKYANNVPIYQHDRWNEIVNTRTQQGKNADINEEFILALFRLIHDKSISIQLKQKG